MTATKELHQWVIYEHPAGHPDEYVVRGWSISERGIREESKQYVRSSLEEARAFVTAHFPNLNPLKRGPLDDPTIVEVWT